MRGTDLSRALLIVSPGGKRRIEPQALPIRIGRGARMDIRVPGPLTETLVGLISVLDDRPLLQASAGDAGLAVNGEPLAATRWLTDGDVVTVDTLRVECIFDDSTLQLSVAYTDTEYPTLPPVAERPAGRTGPFARPRAPRRVEDTARFRKWPVLMYGSLMTLLLLAAYLFTARSVGVTTVPESALTRLSGSLFPLRIGGRYLLRAGGYRLRIEAEGYEPLTTPLAVSDAPRQAFHYELQRLPGLLAVSVRPAVNADLTIDGVRAEQLVTGEVKAAAGARVLGVRAARFQPFEQKILVEGGGRRQSIEVELLPNWADVAVLSRPAGAEIWSGGERLGVTPATVPIEAGARDLEVRKDGFKPWRQALTVIARAPLELPAIELVESDAVLTVHSTPAGAAVSIDGRYRGVTPVDAEVTPGRAHQLAVTKAGFEAVNRTIEVARRTSQRVSLELVQRMGVVRLTSNVADAELWVDGARRGVANQELTLPAVLHRIEVRSAGFATWAADVTPTPGLPQVLEVKLLTPEQAVLASTPATVTDSQGLVLRLVGPGQFVMGAPRREQGRRPNETEHPVRLTRKFFIGTREITNREFREFRSSHTSGAEKFAELAGDEHPAVLLSWEDAAAFCNWLSDRESLPRAYAQKDGQLHLASPAGTGYRLPTEAEWEWVARFNGGGGARRYPWGGEMPPPPGAGNFADQAAKGMVPNVLAEYDDGYPVTAPAGKFAASPLGIYDLGGNAAEWVNDRYTIYGADAAAEAVDPAGPASGQYHVIRGSSWRHSSIAELRLTFRDFGEQGRLDVGFRIAHYAEAAQ